jgi:hypothetical protein
VVFRELTAVVISGEKGRHQNPKAAYDSWSILKINTQIVELAFRLSQAKEEDSVPGKRPMFRNPRDFG